MSVATGEVLRSARMLWEAKDELTLDEVDGEFYWRHCRSELIRELEHIADRDESSFDPTTVFDLLFQLERAMPDLGDALTTNKMPGMRSPLIAWSGMGDIQIPLFSLQRHGVGSGVWLCLGVRNSAWRGQDIERACLQAAKTLSEQGSADADTSIDARANTDSAFSAMNMRFFGPNEFSFRSEWFDLQSGKDREVQVESPLVLCNIAYPFPPDGIIANLYDSVAIDKYQWHTRLYGFGARNHQTVGTAIRTWAIGLLIGAGVKQQDAISRTYDQLELAGSLYDGQWSIDRQNLEARVPEAKPYVRRWSRKPQAGNGTAT